MAEFNIGRIGSKVVHVRTGTGSGVTLCGRRYRVGPERCGDRRYWWGTFEPVTCKRCLERVGVSGR